MIGGHSKGVALVVDDEPDLRRLLTVNLDAAGYEARGAGNGEEALRAYDESGPVLVLLDMMLPDMSGAEVCRRIRRNGRHPQPAIVIASSLGEEVDRVVGFEIGADDYVTKPFSVRELLLRAEARVQARQRGGAVNRTSEPAGAEASYSLGPLKVDPTGFHVYVEGAEIRVSILEMKLLVHLFEHCGQLRSRKELLTLVWGYMPDVPSRTVDTHVKRLRDKLGSAGALIQTVRGIGYRLAASP
jgi:two-component system phosphate regulon response regulator PhoB